ncbi:TrkA C-terminal domain-containing protein [Streptomyces sp. 135]|uniref:aspartate-alanine antiporter-like transporter n=1 Tax=Streptomyces sp. 135 TaxID=2838850 RepID=UPI001CC14793|nr:TrkA C-terminal domain-containing protein [Streptomyces sp. 135]
MVKFLADNPYLTLFGVITLGALLGMVPFGPVKLGGAGALFAGLAVGALDPDIGLAQAAAVSAIGLAVWAYTVGLEAGPAFFRDVGRQLPVMLGSIVCLGIVALAVAWAGSSAFGLGGGYLAGGYAGIGTTTPGLAAATAATGGSPDPAVGYAIGYPMAVVVTIVFLAFLTSRKKWIAKRDRAAALPDRLITRTVEVTHAMRLNDVPEIADGRLLVSVCEPGDGTGVHVVHRIEQVTAGDRLVLVGGDDAVAAGVTAFGRLSDTHLLDDRSVVDYRRSTLTNPGLAGRTIAELGLEKRFDGKVSRVRRGDLDLLAHADMVVQLDDKLRVVAPREKAMEITAYLGDEEAKVNEVSMVALGLGLTLGFLIGIPTLHLGSTSLALGTAAGPLVMGMILGWRRRTGRLVWTLPTRANLAIRQFGLMLFLGVVGLTSGYAFRSNAFSVFGLKLLLVLLGGALLSYTLCVLTCKVLGMSRERTMGLLSGYVGNPAITAYANSRVRDSRINTGYATLFALTVLVKIIFIQFIVGV